MDVSGASSLLGRLADAMPGRALALVLEGIDRRSLTGEEAAAVLVAERRQASHYLAGSLDTMIELGLRDEDVPGGRRESPGEFAAEEPRALLRLTKAAAESEFWDGWALVSEFPAVMEDFRAGSLDWPRARLFPDVLINLTQEQIAVITSRVLPDAPGLTTGQLRARLQREAMAIDPAWWKRAYKERVANRHVRKRMNGDGTADLEGRDMPLDAVCQSMANLTRLARQAKKAGDPRPLETIRADVFLGYLTGSYQQVSDTDIIADLLLHATQPSTNPESAAPGSATPGSGTPGSGTPGSGTPGSGTPGSGTPGSGTPGSGTPGSGTHGSRTHGSVAFQSGGRGRPNDVGNLPGFAGDGGLVGEGDVHPDDRPEPSDAVPADPYPRRGREPLPRRPKPALVPSKRKAPLAGVRPRAGYEVRIKLSTLLGLDEHPGEIPGAGAVHAELARSIVAQHIRGHWRFALCDKDGHLIETGVIHARPVGALAYAGPVAGAIVEIALTKDLLRRASATGLLRSAHAEDWVPVIADITRKVAKPPPQPVPKPRPASRETPAWRTSAGAGMDGWLRVPGHGLRRWVQVRYRTCVAPGCRKPAADCEVDHRLDFAKGGATSKPNLQPLCKWHHRMKHTAGWQLTTRWKFAAVGPCTFRWVTPNGNRVDVRPPPIIDDLPPPMPRE